ncbi:hypothetical protein M9Y10_015537 [Tritrichomonas musculus]|uniref:non-specific serine/threonine protein kinase n=1 Tax=Tritrichomonas musculus TaxID=1915356 RepID=A0ABR2L2J6_9EUKA
MTESTDRRIIPPGNVIDGYEIIDLIGVGGFGGIYKVKNQKTDQIYAMKTESLSSKRHLIPKESEILKELHEDFFPKYQQSGISEQYQINYLIMNCLGVSIDEIQTYHEYNLDIEIVYHVCLIMLGIIKSFHSHGFVHRDIKPNNFLIQHNQNFPLVLIDFGLSKRHIDPETNKPFPCEKEHSFLGTRKYSSNNVLQFLSCGRRDDLISWFYSFLDLACGKLPWSEVKSDEKVIEIRKSFKLSDLEYKFPEEFQQIYDYLMTLDYGDEPDYDRITKLYQSGMENDLVFVGQFDWPSFIEQHSNLGKFQKEVTQYTLNYINKKNREKQKILDNEAKQENKVKQLNVEKTENEDKQENEANNIEQGKIGNKNEQSVPEDSGNCLIQ